MSRKCYVLLVTLIFHVSLLTSYGAMLAEPSSPQALPDLVRVRRDYDYSQNVAYVQASSYPSQNQAYLGPQPYSSYPAVAPPAVSYGGSVPYSSGYVNRSQVGYPGGPGSTYASRMSYKRKLSYAYGERDQGSDYRSNQYGRYSGSRYGQGDGDSYGGSRSNYRLDVADNDDGYRSGNRYSDGRGGDDDGSRYSNYPSYNSGGRDSYGRGGDDDGDFGYGRQMSRYGYNNGDGGDRNDGYDDDGDFDDYYKNDGKKKYCNCKCPKSPRSTTTSGITTSTASTALTSLAPTSSSTAAPNTCGSGVCTGCKTQLLMIICCASNAGLSECSQT